MYEANTLAQAFSRGLTLLTYFPQENKKDRAGMECNIAILCLDQLNNFTAVLLDQFWFVLEIFCSDRLPYLDLAAKLTMFCGRILGLSLWSNLVSGTRHASTKRILPGVSLSRNTSNFSTVRPCLASSSGPLREEGVVRTASWSDRGRVCLPWVADWCALLSQADTEGIQALAGGAQWSPP